MGVGGTGAGVSARDDATPDLDAWRAEAGACAPLDAAATPAWALGTLDAGDGRQIVTGGPIPISHIRVSCVTVGGRIGSREITPEQRDADARYAVAARTGWPRDAARVGVLADRCAALEASIATLSALVAAGDRMEALAERFASRCEAWRTYALAVNVLRLSEGCVEAEEYARLHEEHARAWQAVLAVEPEAAKR